MRFQLFFKNIQQDLKTYIFLLLILCIFRGYFIFWMHDYIGQNVTMPDIWLAMWAGFRLSLKSAGAVALISFIACTITNLVMTGINTERLRYYLGCIYITILSILFQVRIPYYQEFHVTFNQNIFNALNDDMNALFVTMIQEYNLPIRLLGAFFLTGIFCVAYKYILHKNMYRLPQFSTQRKNLFFRCSIIFLIPIFMLFIRFGGSFNYEYSINWENAALTKDHLLNEAILDDVQALYRSYSVNKRTMQGEAIGIDKEKIVEYSKKITNKNINSNNLEDYLARNAMGAKIPKPRHIFIILGESYAQWPILEQYSKLNIASGLKGIMQEQNSFYCKSFLPNGAFTAMAVNGMITGLSDVAIPPNYQQGSYNKPYATALAPQMKKLGYKVDFWYGGFSSWERIKEFSLAQGIDHFYSCVDFGGEADNIWGTKDENIFQALSNNLPYEEPTIHLILTVSNHPPYSLDLNSLGFDASSVIQGLPEEEKNNKELIKELGHYWYMDKVIIEFVRRTYEKYPDSLFIITGDHADRTNISETPTKFERYTIPFVLYGQGITKDILPKDIAGSHTNILPTLIELIAPKGFTYYSIADSLTNENKVGFSSNYWITPHAIGKIENFEEHELFSGVEKRDIVNDRKMIEEKIAIMRTVSWWRLAKGNQI